jgi:ribosomal-protein-alanine acetyltransferase
VLLEAKGEPCARRRRAALALALSAQLAGELGPVEEIEPLYLRVPDAGEASDDDGRAARTRSYGPAGDQGSSAGRTRRPGRGRCSRAACQAEFDLSWAFDLDGDSGKLVGYLIVSRYVDAWHANIAVDPDHRGRGIATMVLERLFELTADDARRGYTLEVRVSNSTAISLYERLGFESRGIRRGYYTDNREDALIMWKDPVGRDGVGRDGVGRDEV